MLLSPDYFLSRFLSFSPYSLGFLPLLLFLPLLSLPCAVCPAAFVTRCLCFSLPGVSGNDMDFTLEPSSALIAGGESRKPLKFATGQY